MLARTAFLLSLALVSAQPIRAEPDAHHPAAAALTEQRQSPESPLPPLDAARHAGKAIVISPASAWGVAADAEPHVHAEHFRRIAIYESVGDRFGAEILKSRLHALGVAKEDVREAAAWTKIHGASDGNERAAAPLLAAGKPIPSNTLY